jgi:hypothetical protein
MCACGKIEEQKYIWSLNLELGSYDFPRTLDGSWNSHLFFLNSL